MFYDLHTIKDKSFRFYDVNSSDLSEVWCLKENENAILWRELWWEPCGQKIIDKKIEERRVDRKPFLKFYIDCDWLKVCWRDVDVSACIRFLLIVSLVDFEKFNVGGEIW